MANGGLCHDGVKLHGKGFRITRAQAEHFGLGKRERSESVIKPYLNGRDLNQRSRDRLVIDLFGLSAEEARLKFPELYQHLMLTVKVEREKVAAKSTSKDVKEYARQWWIFGKPRQEFRIALSGQTRFVATVDTSKHRIFQFLSVATVCDDKIVLVASENAFHLGILMSRFHVAWALGQNTRLGQGDDPVYVKSRCFDPFPFPDADAVTRATIASLGEAIDAHRKVRQREHPSLTLTQMYNVLENLKGEEEDPSSGRSGARPPSPATGEGDLSEDERRILDEGLILILKELHEKLDADVARAYGWPVDLRDEVILARLVELNRERAAEEARGLVRWLRPDYQIARFGTAKDKAHQLEAELVVAETAAAKTPFPQGAVEQVAAVMAALAGASSPTTAGNLAQRFKQGRKVEARIKATLASLARTGFITSLDGGRHYSLRRVA